jgi:AcrR family transcriptional regulator
MDNDSSSALRRGRRREFNVDDALERAMLLFWGRGYEPTSISDLCAAMGITPPSLYAAFGDKKRLFLKALDRYAERHASFAGRALAEEPTAERAVRRLLNDAVETYFDPRHPKGCMIVLAATNCAAGSDDIRDALAARRRGLERAIRDRIAMDRTAVVSADAATLAATVVAIMFGLALMARDGASRAAMRRVVEQFMAAWPRARTGPHARQRRKRPAR